MQLDEHDHADLRQLLDALGANGRPWYVTLHVKHGNPYDSRGINIPRLSTYFEAIRSITSQGGFVVRMGDSSMVLLPRMDGVVDYAHSSLKSARNDILLFGGCRFAIGTASGPLGVPPLFGRPLLATNYPSIGLSQYWPKVRMLPIWFKEKMGDRVYLSTLSKSSASWALNRKVVESEFDVVHNSSEDLVAGVQEMMFLTEDGNRASSDVHTESQRAFENLRREQLGVDGMTIASTYAELHPEVLR
jgi:putative glycosyltransferase (TIGR04372 family)